MEHGGNDVNSLAQAHVAALHQLACQYHERASEMQDAALRLFRSRMQPW